MKNILLLIIVCLPVFSKAQLRLLNDTLYINDSIKLVKGQSLTLGEGSNSSNKDFNFITTAPNVFAAPSKLPSNWNGLKMNVKGFKIFKSKRLGEKYYIVLGGGNIVNYWCDIIPAIKNKEVVF